MSKTTIYTSFLRLKMLINRFQNCGSTGGVILCPEAVILERGVELLFGLTDKIAGTVPSRIIKLAYVDHCIVCMIGQIRLVVQFLAQLAQRPNVLALPRLLVATIIKALSSFELVDKLAFPTQVLVVGGLVAIQVEQVLGELATARELVCEHERAIGGGPKASVVVEASTAHHRHHVHVEDDVRSVELEILFGYVLDTIAVLKAQIELVSGVEIEQTRARIARVRARVGPRVGEVIALAVDVDAHVLGHCMH